jgi:hypothetical protein
MNSYCIISSLRPKGENRRAKTATSLKKGCFLSGSSLFGKSLGGMGIFLGASELTGARRAG